jgi:plasmid stabilization system protein ParE
MRRRLVVRREAQRDIREAASWYNDQQPDLGVRFLAELGDLLERIRQNPSQFPLVESEVRRGLLRRFPYSVYFVPNRGESVTVLGVLHQNRHPDTWKTRARSG